MLPTTNPVCGWSGFNPVWGETLELTIQVPQVSLVYFSLRDESSLARDPVLALCCIPFTSLATGMLINVENIEYQFYSHLLIQLHYFSRYCNAWKVFIRTSQVCVQSNFFSHVQYMYACVIWCCFFQDTDSFI